MANTTNFNWETPDDTDLVKDGAAAIRTLGNSIDTSFVDLKGGTTGQVLSKASNTDLDFTWTNGGDITEITAGTGISGGGTSGSVTITNSMATAIDAKGDLIAGTGADTFARLAVGSNDTILTADSTTATGLKWAAAPSTGANWSLLNTGGTALTGAATVTVTGISGKDKIMVLVGGASSSSAGVLIFVRFNTDTGSNYYNYGHTHDWPTTYSTNDIFLASGAATAINLGATSTNAGSAVSGYVLLSGCNSSGVKVYEYTGSGNPNGGNYQTSSHIGGYYNSSSTISSVSITASSGNLDAGTVFIYTSA